MFKSNFLKLLRIIPLAYPFLVYRYGKMVPSYVFIIGAFLLLVLNILVEKKIRKASVLSFNVDLTKLLLGGLILLAFSYFMPQKSPLIYPLLMNAIAAFSFLYTLIYPPSLIERIACLKQPTFKSEEVRYMRNLTKVWFGVCLFNVILSSITVYLNNMTFWLVYNGCIAYILMGFVFVIDIIYRLLKTH